MTITRRALGAAAGAMLLPSLASRAFSAAPSDIEILRHAYTALHPGLYRYATPAQVGDRLRALELEWQTESSVAGRYLALSRFLASVRCGHSYANFYNQSSAVAKTLFAQRDKLPFHFRWLKGRMIVTADGGSDLPAGSEILAIDGRKAGEILATLMPYARADGSNDAKRVALLEVRGFDRFETFDVFFGLTHPKAGSAFEIAAATPSGVRTLRVEAIDLDARRAQMTASLLDKDAPQWLLAIEAGVATLTMPSWALYDSKWDWRGFLDRAFEEMASRGVRGLIVDLRGNEGGLDCGDEIIARLIDAPLLGAVYDRRVRFTRTPSDLDPYLDTWDPSFKKLGEGAEPVGGGFYRLRDSDGAAAIAPKGPRFRGRVAVLVDAANSSATFQFAQLIQEKRLGTLAGEPTGGNRRGINGGAFFFLRLPQSGLEADLPLIGTFPREVQPDAGLIPDVSVATEAADIAAGRDPVMERAVAMMRG